jgi:tetratricopeptide (TPR) repeat protein
MDRGIKAPPVGDPAERRARLIGIALLAAILYAYYPIYRADFVNYDDGLYVIHNAFLRDGLTREALGWAFGSFYAANWHPLTLLSHLLDYQLYGMNAGGHHLTSVILHSGNTLLLFLLLRRLTGAPWRSALAAFLFALHPLHVESVAWVSERKDVLSTFFMLLALLAYRRFTLERHPGAYGLTILFFALGLLAKPMLVTFPFLLLLLDFWPLARLGRGDPDKGGRDAFSPTLQSLRPLLLEKIPFFILGLLFSVVTLLAQSQGGAVSSLESLSLGARLANAVVAYGRYLIHMLIPTGLGVFYPHPGQGLSGWIVAASAAVLLLFTWLCIRLRRGRPYLLMGWLWYIGTLVPVIGIVQVGMQAMADRYTYIPLIGIFILLAWLLPDLRTRRRAVLLTVIAALSGVAVLMVTLTRQQVGYWMNTEALFARTDQVTQNNILAKLLLAEQLAQRGKFQRAKEKYEEVLRLSPLNVTAHHHYGVFLASRREFGEGIGHLREAVRLQPASVMARTSLGLALQWSGENGEAEGVFQEALQLKPNRPETHYHLAQLHEQVGSPEKAILAYREALRLKPDYGRARLALALLLKQLDRVEEAERLYRQVFNEDPQVVAEAHFQMGRNLAALGKLEDAIVQYREGLEILPSEWESHWQLAEIYRMTGAWERATAAYREILRGKPGQEKAAIGIGAVLTAEGRFDEAIAHFRSVIGDHAGSVEARIGLGDALEQKGLDREAEAAYRSAVKIDPDAEEAHYRLGVNLAARERSGEAVAHFQQAISLRPDHGKAKAALSQLQER